MAEDEFTELANSLKQFNLKLPLAHSTFASQQANKFLNLVKPRTPVDTGSLRASWEATPITDNGDLCVLVENPQDYATHVEYGHRVVSHGKDTGKRVEGIYMATRSIADMKLAMEDDYTRIMDMLLEECGLNE